MKALKLLSMKLNFQMARNVKIVNKLVQQKEQESGFSMKYDDEQQSDLEFEKFIKSQAKKEVPPPETKEQQMELIRSTVLYEGDDPVYEKVVERPIKGRVWGLGGELVEQKSLLFSLDEDLDMYKIISFLEMSQIKDIVEHDLEKYNRNGAQRYGIIGTMFSSHHGYKVCKELFKSFMLIYNNEKEQAAKKKLELGLAVMNASPEDRGKIQLQRAHLEGVQYGKPIISGAKSDEWLMISYKQFMVHLFTEECRQEVDIEAKWMYEPTPEQEEEYERINLALQKHKKGFFEPLQND